MAEASDRAEASRRFGHTAPITYTVLQAVARVDFSKTAKWAAVWSSRRGALRGWGQWFTS